MKTVISDTGKSVRWEIGSPFLWPCKFLTPHLLTAPKWVNWDDHITTHPFMHILPVYFTCPNTPVLCHTNMTSFFKVVKKNHPERAATSALEGKYLPHVCGFSSQNFKLEKVICYNQVTFICLAQCKTEGKGLTVHGTYSWLSYLPQHAGSTVYKLVMRMPSWN